MANGKKEIKPHHKQTDTNTRTTPSHGSRHIVSKKKRPNRDKTSADDKAGRPESKLGYLITGFLAMSTGFMICGALQVRSWCNENNEKRLLKCLTPVEKTDSNRDYESMKRYWAFVSRTRKQELECKGISVRASLRFIDDKKAMLLRNASELDVKLADMDRCPATKQHLRREMKVLQERISELEQESEALKVESNHSTARNLELWAYEDRAVLVTQLARIVRMIDDSTTRPDNWTPDRLSREKVYVERELEKLDMCDVKLKAIINGATEPDSDCRFHKIKIDTAGEFSGQHTKQRPRNGLTRESLQNFARNSQADGIGGAQSAAFEKTTAPGGDLSCCEGTSPAMADMPRKDQGGDESDAQNAVTGQAKQGLVYGKVFAVIGLSLIVANGAL